MALREKWEDPQVTKVGFNLQYEIIWLSHLYGWSIRGPCSDPMIAAHLLDENSSDHSLQALAIKHLNAPPWKDEWKPYEKSLRDLTYLPTSFEEPLRKYNASDVYWTRRLDDHFLGLLENHGLERLYSVEMENLKALARMTTWGIQVDQKLLSEWETSYVDQRKALRDTFPFNPDSPQQVLKALQDAGFNVGSTGVEVISSLQGDLPARLLRYRKLSKVYSTYLAGLHQHIYSDGRIHPRYHQNRTVSGRLSSSDPNGQNFPRDDSELAYRRLFVGTWRRFGRLDFNQLELRVGGHYGGGVLAQVYHENRDIHDSTGERIWRKPPSQISDNERVVSKVTNFTAFYDPFDSAIGSVKLQCEQAGVHLSWTEARAIVEDFRGAYPEWWDFVRRMVRQVYDQGWVRADTGRIRRTPGPLSNYGPPEPPPDNLEGFWRWARKQHSKPLQELLRSIVNSLVQGLAADITKLVGTMCDKRYLARGFRSRVCNSVHDELLFDIYPPEEKEVLQIAYETAIHPPLEAAFGFTLKVPLGVELSVGENWSECKRKENRVTVEI